MFSIVLMICDDFKVSGDFDGKTILCSGLLAMEKGMQLLAEKNPEVINDATKKEIFDFISNNQHIGKEARREHKQRVKNYKGNLEEMENKKFALIVKLNLFCAQGNMANSMAVKTTRNVGIFLKKNKTTSCAFS